MDHAIVGGVEDLAVELVGQHGEGAVGLVADHAAVAVFEGDLAALAVKGVAVAEGIADGVAVGFGAATVTPLFQTSFLPLLTHVYFLPALVEVAPSFVQALPALTAATATKDVERKIEATIEITSK
jgi:hypothetical protein